jgi:hypothetical protein
MLLAYRPILTLAFFGHFVLTPFSIQCLAELVAGRRKLSLPDPI